MSGPRPHGQPPSGPHDAEHDKQGQPSTAPDGQPASGFPEPPGKDPGDKSGDPTPHSSLNSPAD